MKGPVIEVRDLLIVRNGMAALSVDALEFDKSLVYSLIGPNGAGKSTLLLSLMRLVRPDRGTIRYRGDEIAAGTSVLHYRRAMAMVFQEPLLFTTTVFDNVASGLKMRGVKRGDIRKTVERNLELLGIGALAKRKAWTLSGGEAQRVSIARALAVDPAILLMDEPFSSLDAPTRESLITDLDRVIRERGITTVFATHDRAEAIRLADRIIVMNGGSVVQAGSPGEITLNPASEFVASFMGTETILTGEVTGSGEGVFSVSVRGRAIEAAGTAERGKAVTFCVHPDNIILSAAPLEASARNSFRGTVSRIVPLGLFRKVYVDCGFTLVAYVTNRSVEEMGMAAGKEITASFKATAVHVIKTSNLAG